MLAPSAIQIQRIFTPSACSRKRRQVSANVSSGGYGRALILADGYLKASQRLTDLRGALVDELRACSVKMTQSAIAGHLGFSTSYMNDVLKGKRAVTDAFVRRVLERGAME